MRESPWRRSVARSRSWSLLLKVWCFFYQLLTFTGMILKEPRGAGSNVSCISTSSFPFSTIHSFFSHCVMSSFLHTSPLSSSANLFRNTFSLNVFSASSAIQALWPWLLCYSTCYSQTIHLKATTSLAAPDNSCRATAKNNIIIACLRNLKW